MEIIQAIDLSDMPVPTEAIDAEQESQVSYAAVRFNALKHGILSRLAALAHEDHAEFADLLAALIDEHRPASMTERHLIEELATIICRKSRVLLAKGARINEGLKGAASSSKSVGLMTYAVHKMQHHQNRCNASNGNGFGKNQLKPQGKLAK